MPTIKTMTWNDVDGERTCREVVIPIHKIFTVYPCEEDEGETCYVQVTKNSGIHVDVPFKRMREIIDEYYRGNSKEHVDTHPDLIKWEPMFQTKSGEGKSSSGRKGKSGEKH